MLHFACLFTSNADVHACCFLLWATVNVTFSVVCVDLPSRAFSPLGNVSMSGMAKSYNSVVSRTLFLKAIINVFKNTGSEGVNFP